MILEKKGYAYNDLTIIPAKISFVNSRSECNPFINDNMLPIFTAPMASVVSENNYQTFLDNHITPIIPRNIDIKNRILTMNEQLWVALSLKEFSNLFIDNYKDRIDEVGHAYYVCIDIANGHMKLLYELCFNAKKLAIQNNYKLYIMTGNIANPETYKWICDFNDMCKVKVIDYIRVGIGSGCSCITSSNTSIHMPQATLIDECNKYKKQQCEEDLRYNEVCPYIIADGGIRNYSDIIKALALGADYVMIGSLFAQCIESAGNKYFNDGSEFYNNNGGITESLHVDANYEWHSIIECSQKEINIGKLNVKFFGMASADGQRSISGKKTKTAEGITKYLPVKYTLKGWTENMISYLRSAMSYTNHINIKDFIGSPTLIVNSISEIHAVNK